MRKMLAKNDREGVYREKNRVVVEMADKENEEIILRRKTQTDNMSRIFNFPFKL